MDKAKQVKYAVCGKCGFAAKVSKAGKIGSEYGTCPECSDTMVYGIDITERRKIMTKWTAVQGLLKNSEKMLAECESDEDREGLVADIAKLDKLAKSIQKAYMVEIYKW